jgi:hypothetical protein
MRVAGKYIIGGVGALVLAIILICVLVLVVFASRENLCQTGIRIYSLFSYWYMFILSFFYWYIFSFFVKMSAKDRYWTQGKTGFGCRAHGLVAFS